jgi:hypothetical protein
MKVAARSQAGHKFRQHAAFNGMEHYVLHTKHFAQHVTEFLAVSLHPDTECNYEAMPIASPILIAYILDIRSKIIF